MLDSLISFVNVGVIVSISVRVFRLVVSRNIRITGTARLINVGICIVTGRIIVVIVRVG